MLSVSRGIILKSIRYNDSKAITKIYTEQFGLLSFIVPVKKSKTNKVSLNVLQPLTLCEINFDYRERSNLLFIKDFKITDHYVSVPFDVRKSTVFIFLGDILSRTLLEHESNLSLFSFIYHSLLYYDLNDEKSSHFHLYFLMELTKHLGFFPEQEDEDFIYFDLLEGRFVRRLHSVYFMDKYMAQQIKQLSECTITNYKDLSFSLADRRNLLEKLLLYYQLHTTNCKDIKSHEVLEEIFS